MMSTSAPSFDIIRHADVSSTNSLAIQLGERGAAHGTVVVAAEQSRGRGRLTRDFASPLGGLYFSLILRPQTDPEHLSFLTIAAGVVCCQVIEQCSGLTVQLKWPNDLYVGDKKLGGILTETAPYSNIDHTFPFVVIGIGLNINTQLEKFPHPLRESITTLYCIKNTRYDLDSIMIEIVRRLELYACHLSRFRDEICASWQQRDYLYGKKMSWQGVQGTVTFGTGAGLLTDGRYQLLDQNGILLPVVGGVLRRLENHR